MQIASPIAWSTLALTIHADGTSEPRLMGASSFPRHWIYDRMGSVAVLSLVWSEWGQARLRAFAQRLSS